ncbi:exosome complex component rrp43 [Anaeramoeba ignava]|uniref:Ribosomal RNA-processing protein 43 n=1 Tax=Anaeramoeba ignava TaxID=1746090 RepID=A0A9Q0L4S7_ANAIG|nr:exosome complex component rrp43 [Anaeramoeba ignava]
MDFTKLRTIFPTEFLESKLKEGKRNDDRKTEDFRKIVYVTGTITTSHGSSIVKLGKTSVISALTAEAVAINENAENQGIFQLSVNFLPICSPEITHDSQPDEDKAIQQHIYRLIKNSNAIDFENPLFKIDSHHVLCLNVDVYCLNHDGSIFDAALISVFMTLFHARIPEEIFRVSQEEKIDSLNGENLSTVKNDSYEKPFEILIDDQKKKFFEIPIRNVLFPITFGFFREYLLADPTSEEEKVLDSQFTIVFSSDGSICSVYKPGGKIIIEKKIKKCFELAKKRVEFLKQNVFSSSFNSKEKNKINKKIKNY